MYANGLAMVSKGIKSSELSIKHLAKAFYFLFFIAKSKDLADSVKTHKLSIKHQTPY